MIMLCDRMLLNFTRTFMCYLCYFLGRIWISILLTSSFFPIPLIGGCEISVIDLLVASCNVRVYMSTFTRERTMFLWYVSLPLNGEIGSLDLLIALLGSTRNGESFVSIWIVIWTYNEVGRGQY